MNRSPKLVILVAAIGLTGCARMSVSTEVKPDGSWTRSLKFKGQAPPDEKQGMTMSLGPKLEDIFFMPAGAAWKVTKTKQKEELVVSAERAVGKGEVIKQDVVLRGKIKGSPGRLLVNEVIVREIAPGKLEYRETLHWQGERPKDLDTALPEISKMLKSALPPGAATDTEARELSSMVLREFWRMLFGPGDPLLAQILMHPDLMERKIRVRVGGLLDSSLQKKFGDRITPTQRRETVRRLITTVMEQSDAMSKAKSQTSADPTKSGNDDTAGLVAMLFSVRMPGKIVATNGERDDASGEVYWALYAQAAALEDITMTATCETGK